MALDFLSVGFGKCGTTTLDEIMRKNPYIELPKGIKETQFFWDSQSSGMSIEEWERLYFSDDKGKRVRGAIEPTFCSVMLGQKAKQLFGNVKIIFMLRDLSKMVVSYRKMLARGRGNGNLYRYANKGTSFSDEFSRFVKNDFCPNHEKSNVLKSYIHAFGNANVKVVLLEELINNPKEVMINIYNFLNVSYVEQKWISHGNEGQKVSKNLYTAYFIDDMVRMISHNRVFLTKHNLLTISDEFSRWLTDLLSKEDYSKIKEEDLKIIRKLYNKELIELEKITGKKLREIWQW